MITGYFDSTQRAPIPFVRLGVSIPELMTDLVDVPFLVDTGATFTMLRRGDVLGRMGTRADRLTAAARTFPPQSVADFGGTGECVFLEALLAFHQDDGSDRKLRGQVLVELPEGPITDDPSLLGWTLLQLFRFTFDGPKRTLILDGPINQASGPDVSRSAY